MFQSTRASPCLKKRRENLTFRPVKSFLRRGMNNGEKYQVSGQELNFSSLLQSINKTKNVSNSHSQQLCNDCEDLCDNYNILPLHEGLMDLCEKLSPSPEDHAMRLTLIKQVTQQITKIWPKAIVEVFGSFPPGLYLPGGDLDFVIFGNWSTDLIKSKKLYHSLANTLSKSYLVQRNSLQVIGNAKVPIVKFDDSKFNISIDISINTYDGLAGVSFLKKILNEFPCLRILIVLLKQFLAERKLNRVYKGGISSYTLYMMVISFLQRHPRTEILRTHTPVNIAVLLIEFFDLYGQKFNYDNVCISVIDGTYKTRDEFYKKYGLNYPNRASICIEDPCHLGNDIGRGSFCIEEIKHTFLKAKVQLVNLLLKEL